MNELLYKKNLLALSSIDPELSFQICSTPSSEKVIIAESKDGSTVPVLKQGEKRIQLHSLYNPVTEAEKLYNTGRKDGSFVIIYGLGGGYHVLPYIEDERIENILIIDKDKKYLRKILEEINLTPIFTSLKVNILIDPDHTRLENAIAEKYLPSISGNLFFVQLKNRISSEPVFFNEITRQINEILDKVSNDFASQAFFGKRWFKNIINNLKYAEGPQLLPLVRKKAIIAGAGPSLERQLVHLKKNMEESIVFASDTAATFLISNNIIPDYIVSIDCQHITYNHLIGFDSFNIPLIMDIGSPVFLSRCFQNRIYFTSGNPLSRFIASNWRYLQYIDTAGGNVGYTALSVASSIGIDDITLYGIDYSYTNHKPYAKDTFIYKYFSRNSSKINSSENAAYSFSAGSNLHETGIKGVFSNARMDNYYNSMLSFLKGKNMDVRNAPYTPRKILSRKKNGSCGEYNLFASGSPLLPWKNFLSDYLVALTALPEPVSPFNRYFSNLSKKEREIWTTLYPVCASLRKELREDAVSTPEILVMTRDWCISEIEKLISSK